MASSANREIVGRTSARQEIPIPRGATRGAEAPWARLGTDSVGNAAAITALREAFQNLGPPVTSPREKRLDEHGTFRSASAVLAPIYEREGQAWILLTRRTMTLRAHRGEVSFPGGRREQGESLEQAARREAREEIGLRSDVEIVGELDHLSTVTSGSFIVPYVGILPNEPTGLVANPDEVDAILPVQLSTLLEPERFHSEIWPMPDGRVINVHFFDLDEDMVWGATAAMLRQLLGFLTGTVARGGMDHI